MPEDQPQEELSVNVFVHEVVRSLVMRGLNPKIKDIDDTYEHAGELLLSLSITPKL